MFSWFERRLDPYPQDPPRMPPRGLVRFVLHYSRGALPWLVLLALTSALIAIGEVVLFGYLGDLVNRLSETGRDAFWAAEGPRLMRMAVLLLVILAADAVEYISHRAYHEVPWLWRIHAVHHSPEHMDWLSGSRLHFFEPLATRALVLVPTVLVVAYRMATIALADRVAYLEDGRIVATGSHAELMASVPGYARVVGAYAADHAERQAAGDATTQGRDA